jgi:hypothetical protein
MRRVIGATLVAGTLTLSGCAVKLCHPYKGAEEFERDKYECMNTSAQVAHNWGSSGNPFIIYDEMERCLKYRYGWRNCQ